MITVVKDGQSANPREPRLDATAFRFALVKKLLSTRLQGTANGLE